MSSSPSPATRRTDELPNALDVAAALASQHGPALIALDYDGVLSPIVERPELAILSPSMRQRLERLSHVTRVAVVSGRPVAEVADLVAIPGLEYAGSHGTERIRPDGRHEVHPGLAGERTALDAAQAELVDRSSPFEGIMIERKISAIAVHDRLVAESELPAVAQLAAAVAERHNLKLTGGKSIHELRIPIECDKGTTVRTLLAEASADGAVVVPWFIGDDDTDEDAFAEIGSHGVTIAVGSDRPTCAAHSLPGVDAVGEFIDAITEAWY